MTTKRMITIECPSDEIIRDLSAGLGMMENEYSSPDRDFSGLEAAYAWLEMLEAAKAALSEQAEVGDEVGDEVGG